MPKVSIIMSTFNGSKYICDAIESIISQTFSDWELIICDDCSTDDTYKILTKYSAKYPEKFIIFQNKNNLRLAASLNECLKYASGEYIARMDDDDISLPERFSCQVKFLNEHPDVSYVCSNCYLFDNDNNIWGVSINKRPLTVENIYKYQLIVHPTVMIRKDVLTQVGGYTVARYTRRTEDFDLWCKLCSEKKTGFNLDEILLKYREDNHSFKKRKAKYRVDAFKLRMIWRRRLNLPLRYDLYAYAALMKILIPSPIIKIFHKRITRIK